MGENVGEGKGGIGGGHGRSAGVVEGWGRGGV